RLARIAHHLLPGEPEVTGALALFLLVDARRAGRVDDSGELVPLEEQDRTRWDADRIAEGRHLTAAALQAPSPGPYAVQAAIAAVHAEADQVATTDWAQIVALYDVLSAMAPSPVVTVNRAVAVAMRDTPEAGLAVLDSLDPTALAALRGYHRLPAARADLLRRMGRNDDAASVYRDALDLVGNDRERRFLLRRLAEVVGVDAMNLGVDGRHL